MKYMFLIAFGSVGLGMMTGAAFSYSQSANLEKNGIRTSAKIIDYEARTSTSRDRDGSSRTSTTYAAKFQFKDQAGKEITVVSNSSGSHGNDIGRDIEVIYSVNNPYDAVINTIWEIYGLSIALGIFGTIFTAVGIGSFLGLSRFERNFDTPFFNRDKLLRGKKVRGMALGEGTIDNVNKLEDHQYKIAWTLRLPEGRTLAMEDIITIESRSEAVIRSWVGSKLPATYETNCPAGAELDYTKVMSGEQFRFHRVG